MNKSLVLKATAIYAAATILASCQPKTAANSMVSSSIAMTGSAKAATVAQQQKTKNLLGLFLNQAYAFISPSMVDKNGGAVNLTTAWVSIKEIEFEAAETKGANEVDGSEISFSGPYYVDLLSNSPSALDTQAIPANDYRRIKMKLHASGGTLPTGVPTQLSSNSIYLVGSASGTNFSFELDDSTELNIGGANPILPKDGGSLLVEINLANIFKQIDLSGITSNELVNHSNRHAGINLCPSIDASAADLYTCIRKGLEVHADFGEDSDSNHDLAPDEDVK